MTFTEKRVTRLRVACFEGERRLQAPRGRRLAADKLCCVLAEGPSPAAEAAGGLGYRRDWGWQVPQEQQ